MADPTRGDGTLNVKLNDLREKLKVQFALYTKYRAEMSSGKDSPRPTLDMRRCYLHAKDVLESDHLTPRYREVLTKFVNAGDVYYHAKKHGVKSAVLYKLGQEL